MLELQTHSDRLPTRMREGDRDALAAFFCRERDRLWRTVDFRLHSRLRRRIDPDDVLQQAYLAASSRLDHFHGTTSNSAFVWLRLVVVQTLAEIHRTNLGTKMRDAEREVFLSEVGDNTSLSLARQLIGELTSPSGAVVRDEMLARLEEALAGMDPIDREIIALRHFEELSNAQAAEILGIQQKAASIRYVRALARLKAILEAIPDFREAASPA